MKAYSDLQQLNNSLCLRIISCSEKNCSLIFIVIAGVFMFIMPIIVILTLSIEITIGPILTCILAWTISGYFIRLYLWNKYGQEVFIIEKNSLKVHYDYKYFKDNSAAYTFKKLKIFFFDENEHSIDTYKLWEIDISSYDQNLSYIGFEIDEKKVIISHKELPILDIINIAKYIDMTLKL